jgi:cytochrome c556
MPDLFPANSKTGHDTTASPKIWENMPDFKARFVKFAADSKAAQTSVKDLVSLKAAFGAIGKDCGGCHQTYRIKKG